jgi:beta-carotene 3-hydroxylase
MALDLLLFAGTFIFMEIFSWWMHKYVMHGVLWKLHKSHHQPGKGFFEWNDLFPVFFAGGAIALMLSDINSTDERFWIGAGISAYGLMYFLLHDIVVHRRIKWMHRTNIGYLKALIRAHKMHHKQLNRDGGESFGLLWVGRKYFKN